MNTAEIIGLLTATIVLAGFTYAIAKGGDTAKVIGAGTSGWANILKAATQR